MDSEKRVDLEHLIAHKLLEVVSQDDLENTYYDMQREWAETLPDDELEQTARDLGIEPLYQTPHINVCGVSFCVA